MPVLDRVRYLEAAVENYSPRRRQLTGIKYIVIHYTGNTGDTAQGNAKYFAREVVYASAHYFVSGATIYQTVPIDRAAYAVGLGDRKRPYNEGASMYGTINNTNSISIELCGSATGTEASYETKQTAAQLTAEILKKFNLIPRCVYRHYDVTGKRCPAWAVTDPLNWFEYIALVNKYFYLEGEDDEMQNTEDNYQIFKQFMDRYNREVSERPATWAEDAMQYCAARGLMSDGKPDKPVTRAELATVLKRMNA